MTRIEGVDQWNAMVNADGDWFYPDSPDDAAVFAISHGAGFYHDLEATERAAQFKADTLAAMVEIFGHDVEQWLK